MATSKLSFRARALDANRPMLVYLADELPDLAECTPINRAVAQMPTGMEKDEEMESHLQEAIIAQQATTSGVDVPNHVIPTPRVYPTDATAYDRLYPPQPPLSKGSLIRVQAQLSIEKELPEYDLDSSDEEWLRGKPEISPSDLENMMHLLEGASSDTQICQPKRAHHLLSQYDDDQIDDVYDYWLQKRKEAAAELCISSLIARIRTDSRRDAPGFVNPYVAFRRRAEKMQTRKNRKNDEDSYEKMLKLSHDLRKAVTLFEMVKRREKSKLALINLDAEVVDRRVAMEDFQSTIYNQMLACLQSDTIAITGDGGSNAAPTVAAASRMGKPKRRKTSRLAAVSAMDREIVSHAWLKKNAEVWNRPALFSSLCPTTSTNSDTDKTMTADSSIDGRYAFKRRRGCLYRAAIPIASRHETTSANPGEKFYNTSLPSRAANDVLRCIGMARRRIGRGGRVIFDRVIGGSTAASISTQFNPPHPSPVFGPPGRSFRPALPSSLLDSDDSSLSSDDEMSEHLLAMPCATLYADLVTGSGRVHTALPLSVGVRHSQFDVHRRLMIEREIAIARRVEHVDVGAAAGAGDDAQMGRCPERNPLPQFSSLNAITASAAVMDDSQLRKLDELRASAIHRPSSGHNPSMIETIQSNAIDSRHVNNNPMNGSISSATIEPVDSRQPPKTWNGTEYGSRKRSITSPASGVAVAPVSRISTAAPTSRGKEQGAHSPVAVLCACEPHDASDKLGELNNGIEIVETVEVTPTCNGDGFAVR